MSTWRDMAKPIIARVIAETGRADGKALRRALRDAYPFGQRAQWPYKVWLDECARQVRGHGASVVDRATLPLWVDE